MIAEAGLAALWLAAAFALVQLMLAWGAARAKRSGRAVLRQAQHERQGLGR